MDPKALREWGIGFLLLGAVLLVFSVGLAIGQSVVAEVSSRNYPFATAAPYGIALALALLAAGAWLWLKTNPPAPSRTAKGP